MAVDRLLADDIAICDAISMALLAGARDERQLGQLRVLLAPTSTLPTTPADYERRPTSAPWHVTQGYVSS